MQHKVYSQKEMDAILQGEDMEQNENERHEQYVERIEQHLSSASKELLKQIVYSNRLKHQIEFLIDKLQDIDFVLHGESARNINWYEISKAYAYRAEEKLHEYKWGDKVEILWTNQWRPALYDKKSDDGHDVYLWQNCVCVEDHEIRPLKED